MRVSAIIPTYNRRAHIVRAIDSVLAQTVPVDEIIVVDDGSTDGTTELIRSHYGARVTVINQENMGVSEARRRGIEVAKGEWVAFLDSDDEWLPERTDAFLRAASVLPNSVAWIFGDTSIITDKGNNGTLFTREGFGSDPSPFVLVDPLTALHPRFLCMLQSSVIRRAELLNLRAFSEGFRHGGDRLAAMQMATSHAFAAVRLTVTRWYLTSDLKASSLMRNGRVSEDRCQADVLCFALAAQFDGPKPWAALHEESIRRLCKLHAERGMPFRQLSLDQFKFGVSFTAISFTCIGMLGPRFIHAGLVLKSKLRTLLGQAKHEWHIDVLSRASEKLQTNCDGREAHSGAGELACKKLME